ncbi:MAG: hypothetical protein H0S85_00965 [Desulfovibrionaceae bacterium]|jgi:septal ring factor EnvC (AmiA/AmiB activator)|nr:hypothetical protein [Desulfovibrionaceae bacterium]
MDLSLILLGALGVFAVIFKILFQQSSQLRKEIGELGTEKATFEQAIAVLQNEADQREKNIQNLKRTLGEYGAAKAKREQEAEDAARDDYSDLLSKAPARKAKRATTLVDFLVRQKFLTAEQLAKAQEYKASTKSEMELEQILVMFNHITEAKLNTARTVYEKALAAAKAKAGR